MNESDYRLDRARIFKSLTVSIGEILEDSVEDKTTQRILLDRISFRVLDLLSDLNPSNSAGTLVSDSETTPKGIKALYESENGQLYDVYLIGICDSIAMPQAYYVDKFHHIGHDDTDRFEVLDVPPMADH